MNETPDLFARARTTDPATSHEAAARATSAVPGLRAAIVEALRREPHGLTSRQLAERTGRDLVSISPRLKPMVSDGIVLRAPWRFNGENGRRLTIWVLAELWPNHGEWTK